MAQPGDFVLVFATAKNQHVVADIGQFDIRQQPGTQGAVATDAFQPRETIDDRLHGARVLVVQQRAEFVGPVDNDLCGRFGFGRKGSNENGLPLRRDQQLGGKNAADPVAGEVPHMTPIANQGRFQPRVFQLLAQPILTATAAIGSQTNRW